VPPGTLQAALTTFENSTAAAENGGKLEIAQRNAARAALIALLRQLAPYVESLACEDLTALLSSGFQAVSTTRNRTELEPPVVLEVKNEQSTQLTMRLEPVPLARAYEVRMNYGTNGWQTAGVFTQARKIVLEDLTPGTTYTIQARAIGGTTGSSGWSEPVSHMAT
jgi:hypothetical protein